MYFAHVLLPVKARAYSLVLYFLQATLSYFKTITLSLFHCGNRPFLTKTIIFVSVSNIYKIALMNLIGFSDLEKDRFQILLFTFWL